MANHQARRSNGEINGRRPLAERLVSNSDRQNGAVSGGERKTLIAKDFGVSAQHIYHISTGRSWGYLP